MKTEYTEELVSRESLDFVKREILGKTNSKPYGVYKKNDILIVKVDEIQNCGCEVKIRIDFVWMINSAYYKNLASIDIEATVRNQGNF